MAIFGIGAFYSSDVSKYFIDNSMAYVGWSKDEAPSLYEILRIIKLGDIIYIKSAPPGSGLRVKAVGIVVDNETTENKVYGTGIKVKWLWTGPEILINIDDKYNVRNNTLYEEYNKIIQTKILDLIFQNFKRQ